MKIILTVTDSKGKNVVFVSEKLRACSLEEVTDLTKKRQVENMCVIEGGMGTYVRSNPNMESKDNLDKLAISPSKVFSFIDDVNNVLPIPSFSAYWKIYQDALSGQGQNAQPFIVIDNYPRTTKKDLRERLVRYKRFIFDAAKKFSIDPYLLGAVLIDEIARAAPIEGIVDLLAVYFLGKSTSVGVAQIKIETARALIKNGYYNPDPRDKSLSKVNIDSASRSHLYSYVVQPKHNIFFAAAQISSLINDWKRVFDISNKLEIIATLYSLKYTKPHTNPKANNRGLQIVKEFYRLAKEILNQS